MFSLIVVFLELDGQHGHLWPTDSEFTTCVLFVFVIMPGCNVYSYYPHGVCSASEPVGRLISI